MLAKTIYNLSRKQKRQTPPPLRGWGFDQIMHFWLIFLHRSNHDDAGFFVSRFSSVCGLESIRYGTSDREACRFVRRCEPRSNRVEPATGWPEVGLIDIRQSS